MRILLIGNKGQLGWEFERTLPYLGELHVVDFPEIDLSLSEDTLSEGTLSKGTHSGGTSPLAHGNIRELIQNYKPEVIINATAYTAVDRAEQEKEIAYAVNARSPEMIAEEARKVQAFFFHFSTDYVFNGKKDSPYVETDQPDPLNIYGESKLAGEQGIQNSGCASMIFRTSWVYRMPHRTPSLDGALSRDGGASSPDNFVTKVLRWSRHQKTLKLVADQVSNPTWSRMLAEATTQILVKASAQKDPLSWLLEHEGLYHLAGNGHTSRYDWGLRILQFDPHPDEQIVEEIIPATTDEFPSPATRPLMTALSCKKFETVFGITIPYWDESLHLALQ